MAHRLVLEVFDSNGAGADTVVFDKSGLEETKLASYEQGYSAGWDDAIEAQQSDWIQLRAELARHLQSVSFTYHEARGQVLRNVETLLREMAAKVLPSAAHLSLAGHVVEMLRPMVEEAVDVPLTIVVNPNMRDQIAELVNRELGVVAEVAADALLAEGQAHLKLGWRELEIDLDAVVAEIGAALDAFYGREADDEEDRQYG